MNFSELQRAIQKHVLHADCTVMPEINESQSVPASVRLGIYSDAYRLRLIDGLASNYPCMQSILGETAFAELARRYIDAHPSRHFSIRWFGADLPQLLDRTSAHQPWLAELAQWEWALAAAFDAADIATLDVSALGEVEPDRWPTLRFDFHPSLQRLQLRTNAGALFKSFTDETRAPDPVVLETAQTWLLWRRDLISHFRSAAPDEARTLQLLCDGGTFEDMCEALCEWHAEEQVPGQAATLLKSWIADEWVIAVR